MPGSGDKKKESAKEGEVVSAPEKAKEGNKSQVSEAFQAGMMQIFGEQETYKPTKSQVDKMLSLQEKSMDYTHQERTMYQPKHILDLIAFVIVLLFVLGIMLIIIIKAPQYTGEGISAVIGLIGGSGVGYGFGVRKKKGDDE